MFVLSLKTDKRRLILTMLCISLIAAMIIACVCFPAARTMPTAACVRGDSDEACAAFLKTLGFSAQLPAVSVREIRLPDTFDDNLNTYNTIQKQAGFDLEGYAGERVKYRTYALVDHPDGTAMHIHLYTHDGLIIGGDITSLVDQTVSPLVAAASLTC